MSLFISTQSMSETTYQHMKEHELRIIYRRAEKQSFNLVSTLKICQIVREMPIGSERNRTVAG